MDAAGRTAAYTGAYVVKEQAGEAQGTDCVAIANIVRSPDIPAAMVRGGMLCRSGSVGIVTCRLGTVILPTRPTLVIAHLTALLARVTSGVRSAGARGAGRLTYAGADRDRWVPARRARDS